MMHKVFAKKRGDLAIGLIFTALIAVVAITLILVYFTQNENGKRMYCDLANRYTPRFYELRLERFCSSEREHEVFGLRSEQVVLKKFSDGHAERLLEFSFSKLSDSFSISLEKEAMILSTRLSVSNAARVWALRKFVSDGSYALNVTLPPFERQGGNYTALINISKFVKILNASVDLFGNNYPNSVDLVFAIDSSGSMTEEWFSVCNMIKTIKKNLSDFGVKNLSIRVYCLGEGKLCKSPSSFCKDGILTVNDLKTVPISKFTEEKDAPCFRNCGQPGTIHYYKAGDQYDEAWALASTFISSSFNWLNNSKKMIILISDSDPTGALETECYEGDCSNPDFTGNEQEAIDNAIADALKNGTYVSTIFGDESSPFEGFGVGCSFDPWDDCCSGECNQIMRWMEQLSSSTGGQLIAYRDTISLQRSLIDAVMSKFPSGLKVEINGIAIDSYKGELNKLTSPWNVNGGSESAFVKALENALEECIPDDSGYCLIPINVFSSTEGTVILKNLAINYKAYAYNLTVNISDGETSETILKVPKLYDEIIVFNFTEQLNRSEKKCDSNICKFLFDVSVTKPAEILFENLSIVFKKYFIREALLDAIVDCWKRADFGRSEIDMLCSEFTIPSDYVFLRPIAEEDIASILIKRQWCHIIGSSDNACGEEDNIDFVRQIDLITNIMIEYKAKQRKVVLS